MSKRKKWLLALALIFALSALWIYWRSGGFLQVSGTILVPTAWGAERDIAIYSVTLGKEAELRPYFKNEKYSDIKYPQKRKEDLICSAKNLNENHYAVLRVKNNEVQELMTSKTEIFFPVLIKNDTHIVFGLKDSGERAVVGQLYDYDLNTKRLIKIFKESIRLMERPAIAEDGSILVTVVNFNESHFPVSDIIALLRPDGKTETLFDGVNPVWLADGKSFYYYNWEQKTLYCYDLSTRAKQKIASAEPILYLTLSPDKRYFVFEEGIPYFGGQQDWRLTVMTTDGWVKKVVRPAGETHMQSFGGLDWAE